MLQCSIHGAEDLRIEDVPCPQPGPDQALVKMGAAGICGSDMHYFRDGQIGKFKIQEPLIPGHEASGVIAGLGTNVTGLEEGQRVAINPSHPCGKCSRCREGRENLCDSMFFLGSASVFPHVQGMFREYFLISAKQCIPVSNQVSLEFTTGNGNASPPPRRRTCNGVRIPPVSRVARATGVAHLLLRISIDLYELDLTIMGRSSSLRSTSQYAPRFVHGKWPAR